MKYSFPPKSKNTKINSTPETFKKVQRLPESQKIQKKYRKFQHKRSPTNWKVLVNQQVDQIYHGIVQRNTSSNFNQINKPQTYDIKNHEKSIYERFQEIMETSQVFNVRKKHERQTTGLTDKRQSIWDSPKRGNKDENEIYMCEKKLEQLVQRNNSLKESISELKQSILQRFKLVKLEHIR